MVFVNFFYSLVAMVALLSEIPNYAIGGNLIELSFVIYYCGFAINATSNAIYMFNHGQRKNFDYKFMFILEVLLSAIFWIITFVFIMAAFNLYELFFTIQPFNLKLNCFLWENTIDMGAAKWIAFLATVYYAIRCSKEALIKIREYRLRMLDKEIDN